ncbi:MAG: hypothetical protein H0W12_10985 [Chitinophagaceae bacterium]|nr:hypothetical protein [Chitinophagaceae bacterium]
MKYILIVTACFFFSSSKAQPSNQKPCSLPEASQFYFWLGDWNLTWSDSLHGTNHVEKIFGNCTVQENFNDPNTNYSGKSWSVYNANYKMWQQTWVDSQGGYIALTGNMHGDSLILTTAEKNVPVSISPTEKLINRMVYYNISQQSFNWSWEGSNDGGKTWKSNWLIHYQRKK